MTNRYTAETANTGALTSVYQEEGGKKCKAPLLADITPEMAAQIVRHHILPMFESKSYRKQNSSAMYKELKLSDQLESELTKVRTLLMD